MPDTPTTRSKGRFHHQKPWADTLAHDTWDAHHRKTTQREREKGRERERKVKGNQCRVVGA